MARAPRPPQVSKPAQDPGSWFNVLAVHQNRHVRGAGANAAKKGALTPFCVPRAGPLRLRTL